MSLTNRFVFSPLVNVDVCCISPSVAAHVYLCGVELERVTKDRCSGLRVEAVLCWVEQAWNEQSSDGPRMGQG